MLEKTVHHTISRILRSMTYKVILCSVILLQAVLIIWEHNPPFDSLPFSWKWGALEMFCIAVYVTDIVLLTVAFGWRHFKDKKWDSVFALLTFMAVLDWFLYYAGGLHEVFRFSRPFRPILLISKLPGLRRLAASIFHTFFVIFDIAVLFAITVAFFGLLGVALFNDDHVDGYALDNDNFNNFPDAALAIYILTTTENFPDVMMPALHDRPVLGLLFFVVALFIFLWLLLPLLLAIVYDRYKDSNQRRLRASRVKQYVVAFQHLNGGDGNGTIDLGTFSQLMMHLPEKRTSEEVAVLFEMLDTRGEGELTIEDFLALPRALRMRVQIMEENRRGSLTAGQPDLVHQ
ncbi:TPCN2, partial [Symbiodinium sp. KB8]